MKAVPASRYLLFFTIAILGLLIDLGTKSYVFARLGMPDPNQEPCWVWPHVFGFQTSLNQGALFGMGQGMVAVFAVLSILAALGILYWLFIAGAARDLLLCVALACVMAGVLGNLYDRAGLPGLTWDGRDGIHQQGQPVYAVRDWILMVPFGYHWPNYNIADSLLVCGAGLLVLHAWRHDKHPGQQSPEPQHDAG
jgi:signal peptidase II